MNFNHVWIARHWVAPAAQYVCCNVADGLPFRNDCFSAVIVSDAYHYFSNRDRFNAEVERVAPNQMRVISRVGNRAVMPNEGSERSLSEYLAELKGRTVRVFSEERLVRDYLARRNPFDTPAEEVDWLEHCKWLSFVCNTPTQALPISGEPYPHSVGRIGLNPIYATQEKAGAIKLRFRFPAAWYAYENYQMLEYHAREATLALEDRKVLEGGGWNDSLERLLQQFVLVGAPERYFPQKWVATPREALG